MKEHEEDFADLLGRYLVRAGLRQKELANKLGVHRNSIVNWMNRSSPPESRGQVLRLADELSLSKEERKALIQAAGFSLDRWPTEVWTVPQQHNMFFTGREDVLHSLRELLIPGSMPALTQAICGLGGVGKTHTAAEYAHRFHRYYEAVIWLEADSWESLSLGCIKLADVLGLPEHKEIDQAVAEIQRWLRKHSYWLLVLDNVENPQEILSRFVPTGQRGCVLVTTHIQDIEPLAQTHILPPMSEQEGVLFLLRRAKKIASTAELDQASTAQCNVARQIWQLMDGLPLALDQAGAYILETGCSFFDYQEEYTRRRVELLSRRGKRFIGHESSVATTFSLAFERIKALNSVAIDILQASSLLYSEIIPEEIFYERADLLGLPLPPNGSLDEAIGVLQDYSLIQRHNEEKTLSIHQLVQTVLQEQLTQAEYVDWNFRIIIGLNHIFPWDEHFAWRTSERLLPHVQTVATRTQSWDNPPLDLADLLHKAGRYLDDRAQYVQAVPLHLRALHIRELALGPEDPDVASSLSNLANIYSEQGSYTQAESFYQRALRIREQYLDPEYYRMTSLLGNLATNYSKQGNDVQAESFYQRALYIWKCNLAPEHPWLASLLYGLANLYWSQGKYEQAEPLYQRALRIYEHNLAPEHPLLTYPLYGLAILYWNQGKYKQAELLYHRALDICKKSLGAEHPKTVAIQTAVTLLQAVKQNDEVVYGKTDPSEQSPMEMDEPYF